MLDEWFEMTNKDDLDCASVLSSLALKCKKVARIGNENPGGLVALLTSLTSGSECHAVHPGELHRVQNLIQEARKRGVSLYFHQNNTVSQYLPSTVDMIVFDSWKVAPQLSRELDKHCHFANKWLVIQGTSIDGISSHSVRTNQDVKEQSKISGFPEESLKLGLYHSIDQFLSTHPEWRLEKIVKNGSGLVVLTC